MFRRPGIPPAPPEAPPNRSPALEGGHMTRATRIAQIKLSAHQKDEHLTVVYFGGRANTTVSRFVTCYRSAVRSTSAISAHT